MSQGRWSTCGAPLAMEKLASKRVAVFPSIPEGQHLWQADGRDVHGLLAHAGSAPMVLGLLAGAALAAVAFFVFRARRPSTSAGLSLLRSSTADAPQGMWASE